MICTPRLYTAFWTAEAFRQTVETLEAQLYRHMAFVLAKNLCAEIILKIFTNNKNYLAESGFYGIVN